MNTPICNFLERYNNEERLRLHTPGHNGEVPNDITEIYGADSLYHSDKTGGIIGTSEALTAGVFGAKKTCFSCGGGTLAIQTALALLKERGCQTIAASRYSHRSLVSTAALLRMDIKWLYPEEFLSADVPYNVDGLCNTDAVFVTNIDYYGGTWKFVRPSIPVVVDNAHGAYLRFLDKRMFGTEYLHPLELGFPLMCIDSAHKTLPVLTGGAYLHFAQGEDFTNAKELMALFGSSSPSYLILESLDRFNETIAENIQLVNNACEAVAELKERLERNGVPLKKSDPLRVTINARECGLSGFECAAVLRTNGVECEMADENYVVLMFSATTTVEDCERAEMGIMLIPTGIPQPLVQFEHIKPVAEMPIYEAMFRARKTVPIEAAAGEVCANIECHCPPGVPLVMPGEMFDHNVINALKMHGVKNVSIITKGGLL
ncbi:MAG: amino acid decarboxylase [Oscillospiraceae bacterium]|nr:amino acid decarboxylase [Oscillospiraceae bacterium]